jgi:creatinine amidohydrolase
MSVPVMGMSEHDFRLAFRKKKQAIIPVGSLEQHGPHLPVSTDSIIIEHVAQKVAAKTGAFVLPVIAYGVSFEHAPMFNVSVRNEVLSSLVRDACISLAGLGIRSIYVLNGHHGNTGALQYLSQNMRGFVPRGTRVSVLHYWHELGREFDHAGEVETSLMLAIAPETVHMERAVANSRRLAKSRTAYGAMTSEPGSFIRITGNGVWGDPSKATAGKGKAWLNRSVTGLCRAMAELKS